MRAISWAKTVSGLLIAVAGIVTPLGLYEDVTSDGTSMLPFIYAEDPGPFGYAKVPRSNLGFNRRCGGGFVPYPCPGVNDPYERIDDANGTTTISMDYGWNGGIPQDRFDYFQSGLSRNSNTISSLWDIEWRNYNYNQENYTGELNYMNGSKYVIGSYRSFDSMLLNGGFHIIDGLVVNSDTGAIGFRNHSIPVVPNNGSVSWNEKLLFIEPESVCIPNNLTIQFTIGDSENHNFSDVQLIDNGGLANLGMFTNVLGSVR